MVLEDTAQSLNEVYSLIPQRPPFLFVDRILDRTEHGLLAEKKLTGNEDFFKGHFPKIPIMPGVLLLEAMFQAAGLFLSFNHSMRDEEIGVVTKIESTRFRKMVRPGDLMRIQVEKAEDLGPVTYFTGKIYVDDKLMANAKFAVSSVKVN